MMIHLKRSFFPVKIEILIESNDSPSDFLLWSFISPKFRIRFLLFRVKDVLLENYHDFGQVVDIRYKKVGKKHRSLCSNQSMNDQKYISKFTEHRTHNNNNK